MSKEKLRAFIGQNVSSLSQCVHCWQISENHEVDQLF